MSQASYKDAGVDLELYEQSMQRLPQFLARTHAAQKGRVMELPGGFAGLFRLNGGESQYDDPVLVSGTDGVGTKIKVAIAAGRYDTIGIDLVAMCVNDCLCLGAEPLFFLDYIALAKDEPDLIAQLVDGVSQGCVQAKSALIGGETAIMPDLYATGEFDMAGFSVGVVERERIIDGSAIQSGDVLVGIGSSGFHSNGYSLIRKVVFELAGLSPDDAVEATGESVAELLLRPTRIYAEQVAVALGHNAQSPQVTGIAHVTGGGLAENVERVLPENCSVTIERSGWNVPPEFAWLDALGNIGSEEMFRVFNMGIGLVLVVRPQIADELTRQLTQTGTTASIIGTVGAGPRDAKLV